MTSRRPLPPPLELPKPGFGRRTPPALFQPIMGLFGLGLGWRAAAGAFGVTPAIGDLILGATSILFLYTFAAYLAKPLRRPATFMEDLRVLPGRAGLSAASLCLMLFAVVLAPYASGLATGLTLLAFAVHVGLVVAITLAILRGPEEGRVVTPVFHLSYVGFIIGGLAANALGYPEIARWLLWSMLLPAGLIWGASARQLLTRVPPAPLRPLLAIHLAPASLFTMVAAGAGLQAPAYAFSALAAAILIALVVSARWLVTAGFSPLWGAFTFPLAAFASALVTLSQGQGAMSGIGGIALVAATLVVPWVAYRVFKLWPGGKLAAKTNAAEA
ncbi:tellurium resistance protein [Roseibaca sp. V10]|uniref:Tellurium resistance protein n=1 Tax=Roseinatronobacter domitianus TaxID=2940293 RepID=A0ABT0LY43_9RHOB|nr:tellurium resistance protein [Roseibaca domitiana]MCL1627530.1 tellurium resistance protein [Roseibaca domitiana]